MRDVRVGVDAGAGARGLTRGARGHAGAVRAGASGPAHAATGAAVGVVGRVVHLAAIAGEVVAVGVALGAGTHVAATARAVREGVRQ